MMAFTQMPNQRRRHLTFYPVRRIQRKSSVVNVVQEQVLFEYIQHLDLFCTVYRIIRAQFSIKLLPGIRSSMVMVSALADANKIA